ncbi:hypothetical protein C8J95_102371 [Elizabethkingia sp. YR214]|uniref:hypothetical protein n=1 Tax=Elizabethkingia sp. YR214 TaxID=2135667 RepID=UPI000D302BA3|nr:hypothetical protein [Elizabethkingia sp. YR214]PUB34703.1 hypothetical protein C8J95_102371 [Elizabethkingia sp. YR214]
MWKIKLIGFCLFLGVNTFYYSQSRLKYIKIGTVEGVSETTEFKRVGGKAKYVQLLKEFEESFSKINNGYPEYYRDYSIIDFTSPKLLEVKLYPKRFVSNEDKKNLYFWSVPMKTKIYKVYYDINAKKLHKPIETSQGIVE